MPTPTTPTAEPTTPTTPPETPNSTSSPTSTSDQPPVETPDEPSLLSASAKKDAPAPTPEPEVKAEPLTLESLELSETLLPKTADGKPDPDAQARVNRFIELANETGVNAKAANGLLGLYEQIAAEAQQASQKAWADTNTNWRNELKADPQIGDASSENGIKPEVIADIGMMVDEFAAPGFLEAVDFTGAGNHPAIVKTFANIARVLREGNIVKGSVSETSPKNLADLMFTPTTQG